MYSDQEKSVLKTVMDAIYAKKVLKLRYYTSTPARDKVRLVEPYSVSETRNGAMVRFYQLEPHPGWRLFNLKLILSVEDAGTTFVPRLAAPKAIPVAGHTAIHRFAAAQRDNKEQEEYKTLVLEAVADLKVTGEEVAALNASRERLGLSDDEVRGVLYKVLADFLETITSEGIVTRDEVSLLKELNACLHQIGSGRI
ncbi:MAG: WYL domain-containing protein [Planctomycetota bacterium]|nr:WYL domain-containing protein [Planctomycetota bacterium]